MKYFASKVTFLLTFLKRPNLIYYSFIVPKMMLSPCLFLSPLFCTEKDSHTPRFPQTHYIAQAGTILKAILQPQLLESQDCRTIFCLYLVPTDWSVVLDGTRVFPMPRPLAVIVTCFTVCPEDVRC